jgi:hypothetical protein
MAPKDLREHRATVVVKGTSDAEIAVRHTVMDRAANQLDAIRATLKLAG